MNILKFLSDLIRVNYNYFNNQLIKRKIDTQVEYDYRKLYDLVHSKTDPCFVLSTGRCGTAFLTKIFESHKEVVVYHEPIPELVYYSSYAYKNFMSKHEELKYVIDAARYEQIRNAFIIKKQYIETNNRITFFARQLADLYPQSKFIHLIRNPISFIRSGLGRKWYTGYNVHDEGRIEPLYPSDEWQSYSNAQKIAWLWNETNHFIDDFKESISRIRHITIYAENLFNDTETSKMIFDFLGKEPPETTTLEKIIRKPVNVGKKVSDKLLKDEKEISKLIPLLEKAEKYGYKIDEKVE